MNDLKESEAEEYARWFRCLSDPTRIRLLHLIATHSSAMTVGELVDQLGRSQSTVSRHLKLLADEHFIVATPDGIRTLITVNDDCMSALPHAARHIMGVQSGSGR